MSTTTITAIKNEISRLEHELDRHRRALQILERGDGRATQKPALPTKPAAQPGIKVLIREALTARAPEKLTPSDIAQHLAQQGYAMKSKNIHSRLSELVKAKVVSRQAGKYWIPQQKQTAAKPSSS